METILIFAFYKNIYEPCWDIVRKDSETENMGFTGNPQMTRSLHVCCIRVSTISRIILFLETAFQTKFTWCYSYNNMHEKISRFWLAESSAAQV